LTELSDGSYVHVMVTVVTRVNVVERKGRYRVG
jgi:hypothetical protein